MQPATADNEDRLNEHPDWLNSLESAGTTVYGAAICHAV